MKGTINKAVLKGMKAVLIGKVLKGIIAWLVMKGIFNWAGIERNKNLDDIEINERHTESYQVMKAFFNQEVLKVLKAHQ